MNISEAFKIAPDQTPQPVNPGEPEVYKTLDGEVPYNLVFPSVTLRDIDQALKNWFTIHFPLIIVGKNSTNPTGQGKKIEVVMSTEERWSMMQKHPEMRDDKGQLKLPLISWRRDDVAPVWDRTVSVDQDNYTGITLYVQEYINPSNKRKEYILSDTRDKTLPLMEAIKIQAPKYVSVTYSIIFWSNFTQDLNEMLQHMLRKFGQQHAVYLDENMWFGAQLKGLSNESNDASIQQDERIFKSAFNIVVETGLIDKDAIRRYRGNQGITISFKVESPSREQNKQIAEYMKDKWYLPNHGIYPLH